MNHAQFYNPLTALGRARRTSREVDFGVGWQGAERWPAWRVSWVEVTGEVYACRQTNNRQDDEVRILGMVTDEEDLESRLLGWPERMELPNSLDWIEEQLR